MRNLVLIAGLCAACASETTGESVQVHWVLDQDVEAEHADFETANGFQVHLDEASVELESVYLYAPPIARVSAIAWLERRLVSVAHAHGGVDNEKGRRVLAEWTKPTTVDTLGGASVDLSETGGEGGTVDAVKLVLRDGVVAHVRGTAERDGKHWSFEADVSPAEDLARTVELIELEERLMQDSVVHVRVQPKAWLDWADFSRLGAGASSADADGPSKVSADNQVGRAISIGVRSPKAFSVYIEEEADHAH